MITLNKNGWGWCEAGDETVHGPFDTRGAAIDAAVEEVQRVRGKRIFYVDSYEEVKT